MQETSLSGTNALKIDVLNAAAFSGSSRIGSLPTTIASVDLILMSHGRRDLSIKRDLVNDVVRVLIGLTADFILGKNRRSGGGKQSIIVRFFALFDTAFVLHFAQGIG